MMDLRRFEQCLDTYGAELDAWPLAERQAGEQLLATSETAQQIYAEAVSLANMLDQVGAIEPSASLMEQIADIPLRHPRPANDAGESSETRGVVRWWPFETFYKPAVAMAAATMMGILTGSVTAETWMAGDADADRVSFQVADGENAWTEQELDELSELAFALHLEQDDWDGGEWP